MQLVGQPAPSPALQEGLQLLAAGKQKEGETILKRAAMRIKAQHGSGSHPLAQAYADLARFHFSAGHCSRAAREFQHASQGPLPPGKEERQDRLSFLIGVGTSLARIGKLEEAEKVLRQSLAFARNHNGGYSASAAVAIIPLSEVLFLAGKTTEAANLAMESFELLRRTGDAQICLVVGLRAQGYKATARTDDPFADLDKMPDDVAARSVVATLSREWKLKPELVREVLSQLLAFVDRKYGDGHALTCDVLAAIAHYEARLGAAADQQVLRYALRRSVWSYAIRRVPGGLLTNLEVGFEPGGLIHLAPHVSRSPNPVEASLLETTLNQAIDDLYSRPASLA